MSEYSGFSLDIEDFKKYYKTLEGFEIGFDDFLKSFMYEMGERYVRSVKPKTPKDTGALRRSWQVGDVHFLDKDVEIEILNGMEYASYVENGHRTTRGNFVRGRFFMRTTTDNFRKVMPRAYSIKFKDYLKSKGIE